MKKNYYTICVIGGDGIGPEVIEQSLRLLDLLPLSFRLVFADAGFNCYQKYGTPLPEKTIEKCKSADAIFFGAVTTPPHIPNYFSPIVRLRKLLDLYANVRPIFSLPLPHTKGGIDCVIVRENTEDLYCGREHLIDGGAVAERLITKAASKRIIEFAFQLAHKQNRKKVTVVHKANILRLTDGLFLQVAREIEAQYPEIEHEDMLVDATAMRLIKNPEDFDVIVTTNMFGDILSDEAVALVGGLGVAASANLGKTIGLFEPVHGSCPKYQGLHRANPLASFFALCLMLEFLNEEYYAKLIRQAILKVIGKNIVTVDLGGQSTTEAFTDEVIHMIQLLTRETLFDKRMIHDDIYYYKRPKRPKRTPDKGGAFAVNF